MIKAIACDYKNFYCKGCNVSHKVLYIDEKNQKFYCSRCIPESLLKGDIEYYNQNREKIERKEE